MHYRFDWSFTFLVPRGCILMTSLDFSFSTTVHLTSTVSCAKCYSADAVMLTCRDKVIILPVTHQFVTCVFVAELTVHQYTWMYCCASGK